MASSLKTSAVGGKKKSQASEREQRRERRRTFVEEHHDLLEGPHEVDVVVAVLLDLQQQAELRQTLGGEGFQQEAVLLPGKKRKSLTDLSSSSKHQPRGWWLPRGDTLCWAQVRGGEGASYLQVFDGLFSHQLLLLVPLHTAHHAGPDDTDHCLL